MTNWGAADPHYTGVWGVGGGATGVWGTSGGATQSVPPTGSAAVLSVLNDLPAYVGETMTASGPNVGVGDLVVFGQSQSNGGVITTIAKTAPLTRVNQNSGTFVVPDGVEKGQVAVAVRYLVNGVYYLTNYIVIDVTDPPATGPSAPDLPPPTYGYSNIGEGNTPYPMAVKRWVFFDPYDPDPTTNTWTVPVNPNDMTTPFPQRQITTTVTTAVTGQVLLWEGAPKPQPDWQFSGVIFEAKHYDMLRSWVYDRRRRIQITDHYGRVIVCVPTNFDAKPKRAVGTSRARGGALWYHQYTVHATVISVGPPTEVPAAA